MREIKFRVWDNLAHFYWGEGEGMDFKKIAFNFYDTLFEESRLVFEEYTGLKDKNGVEIYEGDVIKYHRGFESKREVRELTSHIKFQDAAFGFDMKGYNDMFMSLGDDSDIEVVGNVFENKDLLEKEH